MRGKRKNDLVLEEYQDDESIYSLNNEINSKSNDYHNKSTTFKDDYDDNDYDEEYYVDGLDNNYEDIDNSDEYYYEDGDNKNLIIQGDNEGKNSIDDNIYEEYETDGENFTNLFLLISTWFGRIGIIVAIILVLYFIFNEKFINLILYIIGLVVAYFFGYGFMYLLEKYSNN